MRRANRSAQRHESTHKPFLKIAVLSVVGFLAAYALLIAVGNTLVPPDDDLRVQRSPVPDSGNAYPLLVELRDAERMPPLERKSLRECANGLFEAAPARQCPQSKIAGWLRNNENALEIYDRFSRKVALEDPSLRELASLNFQTRVEPLFPIMVAAQLSALKAESLLAEGRTEAALDLGLRNLRAGQMMQDSQGFLSYVSAGIMCKELGLATVRRALERGENSGRGLSTLAQELPRFDRSRTPFRVVFQLDYLKSAHFYAGIGTLESWRFLIPKLYGRWRIPPLLLMHPPIFNGVRATYNVAEIDRSYLSQLDRPCNQLAAPWEHSTQRHVLRALLTGNLLLGAQDMPLPVYSNMIKAACAAEFDASATELLVASQRFRREKGHDPVSADELAPKFIAAVPRDPFDGQPIRYNAKEAFRFAELLK